MSSLVQLLPKQIPDPTIRAVAQFAQERLTGVTGTSHTLTHHFLSDVTMVFKNGALLDEQASPAAYTLTGTNLTFNTALIVGDVIKIYGWFRGA